jgi:hypothetical protein
MIVASGLEADANRTVQAFKMRNQPLVIGVRVADPKSLSTLGPGTFNHNVILGLGNIDRYQCRVRTRIVVDGHGGIPPEV